MINIAVGVMTGIFSWWIVFHGFRPRLRWDSFVEARVVNYSQYKTNEYSVCFRNYGWRAAIEINTHARLRIQGVIPGSPGRWLVMEIPTNNALIPITKSAKWSLQWNFWRSRGRPVRRILVLHVSAISEGDLRRLPVNVAEGVKSGTIGLRQLMKLGIDSDLTLAAICSDSFSGARHVAMSEAFHEADLRQATISM